MTDGTTHWEDCYKDHRHHKCALERIAQLQSALAESSEELDETSNTLAQLVRETDKLIAENKACKAALDPYKEALILANKRIAELDPVNGYAVFPIYPKTS